MLSRSRSLPPEPLKDLRSNCRSASRAAFYIELPGAISQGETKEEVLANIKEAIELVLKASPQPRVGHRCSLGAV